MHEHRRSYCTTVHAGVFHCFLPKELERQIPKSTLFDLRHRDPANLWASEFADFVEYVNLLK